MNIIEKIKTARRARGITQKYMADMLGITYAHYSKIEAGKVHPGSELIEKMFDLLNIKVINTEALEKMLWDHYFDSKDRLVICEKYWIESWLKHKPNIL